MRACRRNDVKELGLILKEQDLDINFADRFGRTPLHEAARQGHVDCIRYLLSSRHNSN